MENQNHCPIDFTVTYTPKKNPVCYENREQYGGHFDTMQHVSLRSLINRLPDLPKKSKGKNGAMFFFRDDTQVYHNKENMTTRGTMKSIGLCGIDIDDLEDGTAELIQDHFDEIASYMQNIVFSYVSTSGHGLHVGVLCPEGMNEYEYGIEAIKYNYAYCKIVNTVLGTDIFKNADAHCTDIAWRHFLNPTDSLKWNSMPLPLSIATPDRCPFTTKDMIDRWNKCNSALQEITTGKRSVSSFSGWSSASNQDDWTYKVISVTPEELVTIPNSEHDNRTARWRLFCGLLRIYGDTEEYYEQADRCCRIISREYGNYTKYHAEIRKTIKDHSKYTGPVSAILAKYGYTVEENTKISEQVAQKIEQEKNNIESEKTRLIEAARNNISDIKSSEDKIEVKQDEWLEDHKQKILDKIRSESRKVCIEGTTGIGKTTTISNIALEMKAIVLVPFISLRPIYEANGLKIILDENEFNPNKACCMTYDRFTKVNNSSLFNKTIFVDESHVLFMDRTYRKALSLLYSKLNDLAESRQCTIVYVSATPLDETVGADKLTFFRNRPVVNVYPIVIKSNGVDMTTEFLSTSVVTGFLDKYRYDRNIIFSNKRARLLYDNWHMIYGDHVGILHGEYTKASPDYEEVIATRKLNRRTTLCTSMAFNGLNFDNEDERTAVWSVLDQDTTAWELVQQAGRVRKSVVDLFVVYNEKQTDPASVDEREEAKRVLMDADLPSSKPLTDREYADNTEIESYIQAHKDPSRVFEELNAYGYFKIHDPVTVDYGDRKKARRNKLKEAVDKSVKTWIADEKIADDEIDTSGLVFGDTPKARDYFKDIIHAISETRDALGCTLNRLVEVIAHLGTKYIIGMCNELRTINLVWTTPERFVPDRDRVERLLSSTESEYAKKMLKRRYNEFNRIREKYGDCADIETVLCVYQEEQDRKNETRKEGNSNGGKKGGKTTGDAKMNNTVPVVVTNLKTGEITEYKSLTAAAAVLKCTTHLIKSKLNGNTKSKKLSNYEISLISND